MILCLLAFAFLIPNIVEGFEGLYDKPSNGDYSWWVEIPETGYCYWATGDSDAHWWQEYKETCEYFGAELAYIESLEEWELVKARCGAGWIESNKTTTSEASIETIDYYGSQVYKTEGTCYKLLNDTKLNWENAKDKCENLGMNITLAVIQDADYLSGLLLDNHVSNGRDGFWIGPKDNTGCYYMKENMQDGTYLKEPANCNQKHHPICKKKWSRIDGW